VGSLRAFVEAVIARFEQRTYVVQDTGYVAGPTVDLGGL
jgi:hypothetical protein